MGFGGFGFNTAQGTAGGFAPAQGGSDFTPADLTGVACWWDAGFGTDTSPVGTWTDRVSGKELSEATNKPTLVASGQNGQPVIRFDGTQYLTGDATSYSQPNTIFLAGVATSLAASRVFIDGSIAGSRNQILVNVNGSVQTHAGSTLTSGVGEVSATTFFIATATFNNTTSVQRIDGVEVKAGAVGTNPFKIRVGGDPTPLGLLVGDIGTVIIVDGLSSAADIALAEAYLADKYGVTI